MQFVESLEFETWFRAVEALSERARLSAVDLEQQLRHAYHLMQMAPLPVREAIRPTCDEVRFEQFLACEAFESAAMALIPTPLKYSVARGSDAAVLATIALPGEDSGQFSCAEDCASALLQAWALSMLSLMPKRAVPQAGSTAPAATGWAWSTPGDSRRSTGT